MKSPKKTSSPSEAAKECRWCPKRTGWSSKRRPKRPEGIRETRTTAGGIFLRKTGTFCTSQPAKTGKNTGKDPTRNMTDDLQRNDDVIFKHLIGNSKDSHGTDRLFFKKGFSRNNFPQNGRGQYGNVLKLSLKIS